MMRAVPEKTDHRRLGRYALVDTGSDHVWGVCGEVEGLFRDPPRATYELFGWTSDGPVAEGWVGAYVWLVPADGTLDAWMLEDVESLGRHPGTDSHVLTGLDEYLGPPEGYRAPVRLHNECRWLGSCAEFTRILPPERAPHPLVLRGLTPSLRLREALVTGTRRSLDLGEAELEIRDGRGELLTDRMLSAKIRAWSPSSHGTDLIDLELGGEVDPVPGYARPVWEQWLSGPPDVAGVWTGLDTRRRGAWLDLVRERGCRLKCQDRAAGHVYELDGRHVTDEPGLYLALGEAISGPGGYFGGNLDALDDCLGGTFGYTAPSTLLWRDSAVAREHLSCVVTPEGETYDLVAAFLDVLAEGGMRVIL
ncbi:barstar family protein [Streptomyces sp. NPDC051362]|uniref:barstar family protein n=1 Tax=Streptomyces sp. NPDC051362 TaxID=3365651 RepID=UPI00378B6757